MDEKRPLFLISTCLIEVLDANRIFFLSFSIHFTSNHDSVGLLLYDLGKLKQEAASNHFISLRAINTVISALRTAHFITAEMCWYMLFLEQKSQRVQAVVFYYKPYFIEKVLETELLPNSPKK